MKSQRTRPSAHRQESGCPNPPRRVAAPWRGVALLALVLAAPARGATLQLTWTAPATDGGYCPSDPRSTPPETTMIGGIAVLSPACTDLAAFRIYGVRYHDMDTTFFGEIPAVGLEGQTINADLEIAPGTMGQVWVTARDLSGNESCPVGGCTFAFPAIDSIQAPPVAGGAGLAGDYFTGQNFDVPAFSRADSTINFTWGSGSAWSGGPADNFSVRWTGTVTLPAAGSWTFYYGSDDGCRLWIDGAQVISDWRPRWAESNWTGTLGAGPHSIRAEYFEAGGGAFAQLSYSGPGVARRVVPAGALSH